MCRHRGYTYTYYTPDTETCPQGGSYDSTTGKCTGQIEQQAYLFTYTTKDANGNYVEHYVAKSQQDCLIAENSPDAGTGSDCDYSAETQQNVANWFSYYRTRLLLAKTGIMQAFSTLGGTYRVGFGSINGNNDTSGSGSNRTWNLPNHASFNGKDIAQVAPFGDGSAGSQKASLWNWIAGEKQSGSTPLRAALKAVGEYYQSSQPWQTFQGETNYKSTGTNPPLACRQAYTILTTDGFWNGDANNLSNADDTDGPKISNPNGGSYTYKPSDPFQGSTSSTLADVAMYYWDHDLADGQGGSPDIANEVPTNDADPAFWQHMVTFTLGMGFLPEYKSKSSSDNPPMTPDMVTALFSWSQSGTKPSTLSDWDGWLTPSGSGGSGGSLNNINDLVHAGVNGHGGFYAATDPVSFVNGIQNALNRARERTGSGAGVAANSTQLQSDSAVYQAIYHTVTWTGELRAFPITTNGLSKTQSWDAADKMPAAADRNIQTWNPSNNTMVAFKDSGTDSPPAGLSSAELSALGSDATTQAQVVDWLRGSHADEQGNGGTLRNRTVILGDIVDSQPVYVGQVDPNQFAGRTFTGSGSFSEYASDQDGRSPRLYVASNDGMLHGFDAGTGKETFAFLPAAVITGGIAKTAQPDYGQATNPHQFFNDGQLTVADAYFAEGSSAAAWHSILVGTTGRGPVRAVYALDVTDPDNVKVLWERSAGDGQTNSGYIGQITGKPIIAQVADASGNDQWVVLIGNGYNSAKDTAALLQFNLATGALDVHTAGTSTGDGLATPAVWLSRPNNGLSDVAYAGDILGNVWKFSLVAYGTDTNGNGTITGTPDSAGTLVYVAKDSSGTRQPITAGMLIGQNPDTSDLWLFFGTGRYLAPSDISDTSVQTWYGLVVDAGLGSSMTAVTSTSTRANLAQRKVIAQNAGSTVTTDGTTVVTSPTRVISLPHDVDASTPSIAGTSGWYIDLLAPTGYTPIGERMVIPTQFDGTQILGTSIVPKSSDVCNPSGTSWLNQIDPFTGTNPTSGGFDVNHDGVVDSADMVTITITDADGNPKQLSVVASGIGTYSMANSTTSVGRRRVTSLTNGDLLDGVGGGPGDNVQRVSWRELVNP